MANKFVNVAVPGRTRWSIANSADSNEIVAVETRLIGSVLRHFVPIFGVTVQSSLSLFLYILEIHLKLMHPQRKSNGSIRCTVFVFLKGSSQYIKHGMVMKS